MVHLDILLIGLILFVIRKKVHNSKIKMILQILLILCAISFIILLAIDFGVGFTEGWNLYSNL